MHGPLFLFFMRKLQQKIKGRIFSCHYGNSSSKDLRSCVLLAELAWNFLGLYSRSFMKCDTPLLASSLLTLGLFLPDTKKHLVATLRRQQR